MLPLSWSHLVHAAQRARLLRALALLLLLTLGAPGAGAAAAPAHAEKVGAAVADALGRDGQARVIIALPPPASLLALQQAASPLADGSGARAGYAAQLAQVRRDVAAAQADVLAALPPAEFTLVHRYAAVPALAGVLHDAAALARLAALPGVARVDLDGQGAGTLGTVVPYVQANLRHARGNMGAGVVVAVVDSGIDTDHSDFAGAISHQACFLATADSMGSGDCPDGTGQQIGPGAAEDDAGHGTHVTGIVASRGVRSARGAAPGATIEAIKVTFGPSFAGGFWTSDVVAGLDYLVSDRLDVQVVNMSLGTFALHPGSCDAAEPGLAAAINLLHARGVTLFASAGNNSTGTQMSAPACIGNVIAVGATTTTDAIASFSNASPLLDMLAPGVGVESDAIGDGTTTASGTSMASPLAAGCAALLIASGEAVAPAAVEAWLEASPVRLLDARNGTTYPRLVCAPTPPAALAVSGPAEGETNAASTLVAAVSPLTTTVPLTYTWQVTGETTLQHTAGLTATATFTWTSPGLKLVSVTASDGTVTGTVTATHTIDVVQAVLAPAGVGLSGPSTVAVNTAATFTAAVAPISTTVPLTYVWEVAGQAPITRSGGLSDTLTLTWSTPGSRAVSVTASNGAGAVSDSLTILVQQRVYLPHVRR